MVRFGKKFIFLNVAEVWFGYKSGFRDALGLTAWFHVKNLNHKVPAVRKVSYTVENYLDQPEEVIFSNFQKTVKTEIKQAEKLNVKCFFHQDTAGFTEFYNEFAASRKIALISERRLKEMGQFLALSYATYDDMPVVAHSYLVDKEAGIARLLHSASKRLDEKFDKQLTGRANKLLHYRDMLYFKEKGFSVYDFGGFAENTADKGLMGINNFKLSFGGQKITCNNYSSYSYFIFKKIAGGLGLLGRE